MGATQDAHYSTTNDPAHQTRHERDTGGVSDSQAEGNCYQGDGHTGSQVFFPVGQSRTPDVKILSRDHKEGVAVKPNLASGLGFGAALLA